MDEAKKYTLRGFQAEDIFQAVKIINKIGLKKMKSCLNTPEVKEAMIGAVNGEDAKLSAIGLTVMLEIAELVVENLPECKEEIYALLAALSGMEKAEIAKLPGDVFIQMVMDVLRKEEFRDFFQRVFGSSK